MDGNALLLLTLHVVSYLFRLWRAFMQRFVVKPAGKGFRRKAKPNTTPSTANTKPLHRNARKPDWVRDEVMAMAVHLCGASCRHIETQFNRKHEFTDGMTIGHAWVAKFLKSNRALIARLRHEMKQRKQKSMPNHLIWAMDITFVQETPVIGILDHGSRTSLRLKPLRKKSSVYLLRALLDAIEAAGEIPTFMRTDNEAVFCSRLFRFGLKWLCIKHQRTDVASPWQNGRIERFFGTLKDKLRQVVIDHQHLAENLETFRYWYNHVRAHQNLGGRTPYEALTSSSPTGSPCWFVAWDGVLHGYLFKPK